jgi:hypothetical protein
LTHETVLEVTIKRAETGGYRILVDSDELPPVLAGKLVKTMLDQLNAFSHSNDEND